MRIQLYSGQDNLRAWLDKKVSWVVINGYIGKGKLQTVAIIHGRPNGELNIPYKELEKLLGYVDIICCCYPNQVLQHYRKEYPVITNKIRFGWYKGELQLEVRDYLNKKISLVYINEREENNV